MGHLLQRDQSYYRTKLKSATPDDTVCDLKMYQELSDSLNTSLSTRDPISLLPHPNLWLLPYPNSPSSTPIPRLRTSKLRYMFYDISNQLATTALSTDVHQPFRLLTLLAILTWISPATRMTENPTPLCFHSKQRRNNLVNSQATHGCILKQLHENNSFKN